MNEDEAEAGTRKLDAPLTQAIDYATPRTTAPTGHETALNPESFFLGLALGTPTTVIAVKLAALATSAIRTNLYSHVLIVVVAVFALDVLLKALVGAIAGQMLHAKDVYFGVACSIATSYFCCCGLGWADRL